MKISGNKISRSNTLQPQQKTNSVAPAGFAEMLSSQMSSNSGGGSMTSHIFIRPPIDHMADTKRAIEELAAQNAGTPMAVEKITGDIGLLPYNLLIKQADTSRPLNIASTGGAVLTPEQILDLRRRYGFAALTPQNQYDLYRELTELNALTAAEAEVIGMSHIMLRGGFFTRAGEFAFLSDTDAPQSDLREWSAALVRTEAALYEYMRGIGENPNADEGMRNAYMLFKKNIAAIEKQMAAHRRFADVVATIENSRKRE